MTDNTAGTCVGQLHSAWINCAINQLKVFSREVVTIIPLNQASDNCTMQVPEGPGTAQLVLQTLKRLCCPGVRRARDAPDTESDSGDPEEDEVVVLQPRPSDVSFIPYLH